jgi:hypothetical protein
VVERTCWPCLGLVGSYFLGAEERILHLRHSEVVEVQNQSQLDEAAVERSRFLHLEAAGTDYSEAVVVETHSC